MIHQHTHIQIHSLLCGSPQFILDKLQRVHNSAARLVMKSCKCDHVQPLFQNFHWSPVCSRTDYKISTLCFNTFTISSPVYITQPLSIYTPSRHLRLSSDTLTLCIPSFGQRAFSITGPTQRNLLPYGLQHSKSSPAFKTALKTHLFRSAY